MEEARMMAMQMAQSHQPNQQGHQQSHQQSHQPSHNPSTNVSGSSSMAHRFSWGRLGLNDSDGKKEKKKKQVKLNPNDEHFVHPSWQRNSERPKTSNCCTKCFEGFFSTGVDEVKKRPSAMKGLGEAGAETVASLVPPMWSPGILVRMMALTLLDRPGGYMRKREGYLKVVSTYAILWALLLIIASLGMLISIPVLTEDMVPGSKWAAYKVHGILWCMSFVVLTLAEFFTIVQIAIVSSMDSNTELVHFMKAALPLNLKMPIYLGMTGIALLLAGAFEIMLLHFHHSDQTSPCGWVCFLIIWTVTFSPMRVYWAGMLTHQTSKTLYEEQTQYDDTIGLSIQEIRREFREYYDEECDGNYWKLHKAVFLQRFEHTRSEIVEELAGRVFDDFKKQLVEFLYEADQKEKTQRNEKGKESKASSDSKASKTPKIMSEPATRQHLVPEDQKGGDTPKSKPKEKKKKDDALPSEPPSSPRTMGGFFAGIAMPSGSLPSIQVSRAGSGATE